MSKTILTPDQCLLLHDFAVDADLTPGWTYSKLVSVRSQLLDLGLLELDEDFGWITISDEGLRRLDTPAAHRVLRARAERRARA